MYLFPVLKIWVVDEVLAPIKDMYTFCFGGDSPNNERKNILTKSLEQEHDVRVLKTKTQCIHIDL